MNASKRSAKGWMNRKNRKALEAYEKQLRNRRQEYCQFAEAYSATGRRNRALAVGECVLKLLDELRKLNGDKRLLEGSLFWTVSEHRLRDTDGIKGFRYNVAYYVKSDEDYYTEEEIRAEIEKTKAVMDAETEEFFADDDDGPTEADLVPPFEPDAPAGYGEE